MCVCVFVCVCVCVCVVCVCAGGVCVKWERRQNDDCTRGGNG